MGLVAGRNLLVESATTDLVVFLDADDRLDPAYIEKTLKAMNTAPDNSRSGIDEAEEFRPQRTRERLLSARLTSALRFQRLAYDRTHQADRPAQAEI